MHGFSVFLLLVFTVAVYVQPARVYGPTWLPGLRCVERNNKIRCLRGNDFDKREYDQAFFSGYGKRYVDDDY
ncbi:hypothetical protein CRM22_001600 [Opisthorchis felineus]|uniref:Uncharacterized protein n=1 Tax=Opisthorchis felineus TaxID=147828 RepID=A0A4S2M9W6_OPIFE|nr:hypothetical protein CRM22_001600 [Opisthorchis felineus]